MKKIILISFLLSVLSFSHTKNKTVLTSKSQTETTITQKKLIIDGELKIPLDEKTTFRSRNLQYYNKNGKELLIIAPDNLNSINIYDLKNGNKQISKIIIPSEGPNSIGGEINGFYFHNEDSIFVMSKFTTTIGLLNIKGKVHKKFRLFNSFLPYNPIPYPSTFQPVYYNNNTLYFSGSTPKEKEDTYNGMFIEFDLIKNHYKIIKNYPDKINEGIWESTSELSYDYIDIPNPIFYLSYSISDSVYVMQNNKIFNKFLLKSDHISNNDIFPFSKNGIKAKDYIERAKYSLSQPRYNGILIDKYKSCIYRFCDEKSSYSDFMHGKFSTGHILISDFYGHKLGELTFDSDEMYKYNFFTMAFVTKKGLYVANYNKYNNDDNYLTFDRFVLK